jgi:hypothetical protein
LIVDIYIAGQQQGEREMKSVYAAILVLVCSAVYGQNVRNFGAVGDGKADDTAAFAAAIKAGPLVTVPNGIYRVSQVRLATGTRLVGESREGVVILDNGTTATLVDGGKPIVLILDTTDSRISNLTIRGRGFIQNGDTIGLCLHAAKEAQVENVSVENITGRGVWLQHKLTQYCVFRGLSVRKIMQKKVGIYGIGVWVYGGGSPGWKQPNNCVFYDTFVEDCSNAGVCLDAGTSVGVGFAPYAISFFGVSVRDCAVVSGAAAVGLTGATNCRISDLSISWERERAAGPSLFFSLDNCGVQTSNCLVSDVSIYRGWTTPIYADKTDGSNVLTNAIVHQPNGTVRRIASQTY